MTRTRSRGWLGALPLLAFFAFVFGVPAVALVAGAFTAQGRPSLANLTQSLQGGYLTAMIGSVKLSAVVALLGGQPQTPTAPPPAEDPAPAETPPAETPPAEE
ncbi:hypothetical protein AB0J43_53965, partial [Nonomuraea fuscirosea]